MFRKRLGCLKQTFGTAWAAAACSRSTRSVRIPSGTLSKWHCRPIPQPDGLYLSTLISAAPLKPSSRGCSTQVQLLANAAPIPGTLRFYSRSSLKPLARLPRASQELAAALSQQAGTTVPPMTLSSSRYGMLGTPAAAAGITTEAWLAGSNCIQEAVQVLAGRPRQAHLLSAGDSSADPAGSSKDEISSSSSSSKAAAATSQQQQRPPAAAVVHPAAFCSSKPAELAAQHMCAPCRTTQHLSQLQQGVAQQLPAQGCLPDLKPHQQLPMEECLLLLLLLESQGPPLPVPPAALTGSPWQGFLLRIGQVSSSSILPHLMQLLLQPWHWSPAGDWSSHQQQLAAPLQQPHTALSWPPALTAPTHPAAPSWSHTQCGPGAHQGGLCTLLLLQWAANQSQQGLCQGLSNQHCQALSSP